MKIIGAILMLGALCGCGTPPSGPDLLQLQQQRLGQLGAVNVSEPTSVPFDAVGERRAYLEGYGKGYRSGLTGIDIAILFPADIPDRNAYIRGWYDGQRAGYEKSPWTHETPLGIRVSTEPTNAPYSSPAAGSKR